MCLITDWKAVRKRNLDCRDKGNKRPGRHSEKIERGSSKDIIYRIFDAENRKIKSQLHCDSCVQEQLFQYCKIDMIDASNTRRPPAALEKHMK